MQLDKKTLWMLILWPLIIATIAGAVVLVLEYALVIPVFSRQEAPKATNLNAEMSANTAYRSEATNSSNSPSTPDASNIAPVSAPMSLNNSRWRVDESVRHEDGSYRIIWDYQALFNDKTLKLTGKKVKVDGKAPTSGELKAMSDFDLSLNGIYAKGSGSEENYRHERITYMVDLTFADDFRSFSGTLRAGAEVISRLTGYRQD